MRGVKRLAERVGRGLEAAHPKAAQDGHQEVVVGGGGDGGGTDTEYGGTGEFVALGDGASGHARAMAAAITEEPASEQSSDHGAVCTSGVSRRGKRFY